MIMKVDRVIQYEPEIPYLSSMEGRHIVAALSVHLTVHPSYFRPEHISKSIEVNLMKLDTLLAGHEGIAECKSHNLVTPIYRVTS